MKDDVERRLRHVTPRGVPPELRPRVLGAVSARLGAATFPSGRRTFRPGLAVAAGLLLSLALNYAVNDAIDRRLANAFGPPPVSRQAAELADEIASITDPATGRWAYERLAASRPDAHGDDARRYAARLQRMIHELTVDRKETTNEAPPKSSQMDRDRRGGRDRHPVGAQCVLRLEHRHTA